MRSGRQSSCQAASVPEHAPTMFSITWRLAPNLISTTHHVSACGASLCRAPRCKSAASSNRQGEPSRALRMCCLQHFARLTVHCRKLRPAGGKAAQQAAMHTPPLHHTCSASSRVGEMMMAPVPLRGMNLARYSSSTQGTRKASVLPEPARQQTATWGDITQRAVGPQTQAKHASPCDSCRFRSRANRMHTRL